jgi:hypothetical protein
MDTYRIIGSFDRGHLERWILEQKRKLASPWRVAGHSFIVFQKDKSPYIYKSLANIHVDSIKDLFEKFPDSFILCVISEVFIVYSRPKNADKLFPTLNLEENSELPTIKIKCENNNWNFKIVGNILTNRSTFSTENIYFEEDDMHQSDDNISLDFSKKQIITKVIYYDNID